MMRTTIDINPELLDKLLEETGERSRGRAVDRAMEEFLRCRAVEKLLAARGKFHLKVKHAEWEEAELAAELEHDRNRK